MEGHKAFKSEQRLKPPLGGVGSSFSALLTVDPARFVLMAPQP